MEKLTIRQNNILEFIRKREKTGNREIKAYLEKIFGKISRITVVRDINALIENGFVKKIGKGRSVHYIEIIEMPALEYINIKEYFKKSPDERKVVFSKFNFDIFK